MRTTNTQKSKYFCIFDYFLDGIFLKWEEIEGECPILVRGEKLTLDLEDGTTITAKLLETKSISDNERQIFLTSL